MGAIRERRLARDIGLNAVLAVAYAVIGWLGLQVPYYGEYVTLAWAPTAIALSAVVLAGAAMIPGVYLGSLLLNLTLEPGFPMAGALIAFGNTLGPAVAAMVLRNRCGFRPQLDRGRDALMLLAVGVLGTGIITSTFGAFWLCLFGATPWREYVVAWLAWFGGEAAGTMIVAPLLLTWLSTPDPLVAVPAGPAERVANVLAIAVFAAIVLVYGQRLPSLTYGLGILYLWTLFRAGMRGIALGVVVAAFPLVVGTALGSGPFIEPTPRAGMLSLWMTLAVAGSACCTAGALLAERDRAIDQQRHLLAELDHRVKNTLATVVALAERSRDAAVDVDDFRSRFISRVRAIARTHEGLARSNWEPMQVKDVVAMTLSPFAGVGTDLLQANGDGTTLAPSRIAPLTMVLHELATNAAKYGAWSQAGGRVAVAWAHGGDDSLRLDWRESGGPGVSATPAPGYGLRLIEGIVDHQLGGHAELAFRAEGLLCILHIPVP